MRLKRRSKLDLRSSLKRKSKRRFAGASKRLLMKHKLLRRKNKRLRRSSQLQARIHARVASLQPKSKSKGLAATMNSS